jgi:peptidoglycan/LPS O-acetylase OafA/YrhL
MICCGTRQHCAQGQLSSAVLLSLLIAMIYQKLCNRLAPESARDQYGVLRHLPVFVAGVLAYRIFQHSIEQGAAPRAVGMALLLGAVYLYVLLLLGS